MHLIRPALLAALALSFTTCKSFLPQPAPLQKEPCEDFALDVERVWNEEVRGQVRTAFGNTGLSYARTVSEKVVTKMDDITRDWVMLRESLCKDCLVRTLITKKEYSLRSACLDSALIRQRTLVSMLKVADNTTVEHALDAFDGVSDKIESCQREAVYSSYGMDAEAADRSLLARVEEQIAEADLALTLGHLEQAEQLSGKATRAATDSTSQRLLAEALIVQGRVEMELARYDRAKSAIDRALGIGEEIGDDAIRAEGFLWSGRLLDRQGRFKEAIDVFERARELYARVRGEQSPRYAKVLLYIGEAWDLLGEYKKAFPLYEQALEINRLALGENHADVAEALNNLAAMHTAEQDFDGALDKYRRAHEICVQTYGEAHPHSAIVLGNIGGVWLNKGRTSGDRNDLLRALELHERSLELKRKAYGDEHPVVATGWKSIGAVKLALGELNQALDSYQKALAIQRLAHGGEHPEIAYILIYMGDVYVRLDRCDKAIPLFKEAIDLLKRIAPGEELGRVMAEGALEDCEKKLGK